jgi:hypothetical protein
VPAVWSTPGEPLMNPLSELSLAPLDAVRPKTLLLPPLPAVTVTLAGVACRFPLSSAARALIVIVPFVVGVNW